MMPDFNEFPAVTKEEWLQKISKDLKGTTLEDLSWPLAEGLIVDPFAHADDFPVPPQPLDIAAHTWEICEDIPVSDPEVARQMALAALEGGAEGLCFWLESPVDAEDFARMLDGIYLDFAGLHFAGPGVDANPALVLSHLSQIALGKGLKTASLRGSLAYDPALHHERVDWRYLADLLQFASERFPGFSMITVHAASDNTPVDDLVSLLRQGQLYLQKMSERGIAPEQTLAHIQFSVPIGSSYFYEMAKIRAFRLLWLHLLKAWKTPLQFPYIAVRFREQQYTDDIYTNMIRGTTMAMSAVIGGADRLTVLPYDAERQAMATYPPAFGRRIARNVQQLLKMESGFDALSDPAAGSYYIEKLTLQLAAAAWKKFVQLEG